MECALFGMCSFINVLKKECDQNGMCHYLNVPFWNVIKIECARFGLWLFLECTLLGMCSFYSGI